jgi:hypothetical protein
MPVFPSPTPTCTVVSSTTTHYAWEKELYPCTYVQVFLLFPCTGGPLPKKSTLYDPPYTPYLHSTNFTQCRRIGPLTCLSPLPDRSTHTPVISKSPQNTLVNSATMIGTNEVALWAHQPYIVPFSKLPHSVTGAQSLHFPIRSQPQDPGPTIYTFTFPGSSSELGPRGSIFLTSRSGTHAHVQILSNSCYMFFIIRYCFYDTPSTGRE